MSEARLLAGWVLRGHKSFHNPRAQQNNRGEGRDFDAEDSETEHGRRAVICPLGEAAEEGTCVQQEAEGKDAVTHDANAAETLDGVHARQGTTR